MTATTIRVQMAQRKDTAANWTSANPILLSGEIGYETDTKKFKIGNGSSNWNSLAYLPIPDGSGNLTITGNLEIGSTGSLTFEGSTADGFETTLAVANPTADRTITLPDRSGTVITSGDTGTVTSTMLADGTIVNADISATAEIAVSKLANGTANQIITTDGTDVSWSSNLNLAGDATIQGDLTVNGTTTTIDTQTLLVEDKNIEMGVVATPTDVTADAGGITLRGTTNKTINWINATGCWTSSENLDLASGKSYFIDGAEVINSTALGNNITDSSLTSVGTLGSLTVTDFVFAGTFIPDGSTAPSNGMYLPAANTVSLATNSTERLRIDATGQIEAVSLGTAVAPTFSFTGDPNTGIYSPGADQLAISTGGSGRLFVNSNGDIGLGTSSPDVFGRFYTRAIGLSSSGSTSLQINAATGSTAIIDLGVNSSRTGGITSNVSQTSFSTLGATPLILETNSSERLRIDSSGRLLVGTSSARSNFYGAYTARAQIEGVDFETAALSITCNNATDINSGVISLNKSGGATVGSNTIVSSGERLGSIRFQGNDGTNFIEAAYVLAEVDGTPGANDMPGRLVFSTTADGASSPTERMRIGSNGQTKILGSSAPLTVRTTLAAGTSDYLFLGYRSATNMSDGVDVIDIFTNGNIVNTNNSYGAISDAKLKENIADSGSQWSDLKRLKVRKYNFKEETGRDVHTQIGLIAQEVELISPGLVSESPDRDKEGNDLGTVTKSVNYSVLYMKAVKALQEAMERIETLEAKVAALESA